jgi:LCP family protein required for cell wall assembly
VTSRRTSRHDGAGNGLPGRLDPRAGRPDRGRGPRAGERPAVPATRRRGARGGTLAVRSLAALLSAAVLATTGWSWYLGQLAQATVNRTDAIPSTGNEGAAGAAEAVNLLLVGTDSRADLTEEQKVELNTGDDSGLNTDTIILVHVPADGSGASFVSFPRDSYVEIPGYGWDKLNAAYAHGYSTVDETGSEADHQAAGAQLLVQTVHDLTGLEIDHYAEVDLLGFFELTSVVGGVEVNLCQAVDDRQYSGAYFPAGPQTIEGADALRFVRQRHNQGENGRGDYDRIIRQQVFLAGVLRNMISSNVLLDLGRQHQLVQAAANALTVDEDLDLFQLAQQLQSVTLADITFQTVPYVGNDRDEQDRSIVRLEDEEALHRFFAELSAEPEAPAEAPTGAPAEPPAPVDPADVRVEVLNGAGVAGLAAGAKAELEELGFTVTGTGNAETADHARTLVRHATGDEALAAALAAQIPGAVVEVDETVPAGTVQLVLGADFDGVGTATTVPPEPEEVAGEDFRTADDRSCIN